jgi:hypothetical protein
MVMEPADRSDSSENPYLSPKTSAGKGAQASAVDIFTASSAFEVGQQEKHDVRITWSLWSGEEIYEVDDREVLRMRSFDFSGVRTLEVGDQEKHTVEVRFRSFPFNVVEVHIDGQRRIRNLFPRLSLLIWTMAAVIGLPTGLIVAWFLYFRS